MAQTPAILLALTLALAPAGARVADPPLRAVVVGARFGARLGTEAATHHARSAPADARQAAPHGWRWPMSPRPEVVRPFAPPPQPWASGHRGVDLLGRDGQAVLAAGAGVVAFSAVIAGRGVVVVAHLGGWRTTYQPVRDRLPRGTAVAAGESIGTLDTTGSHCAPRACLHWAALTGRHDYHDPLALLRRTEPVLLPLPS